MHSVFSVKKNSWQPDAAAKLTSEKKQRKCTPSSQHAL